MPLPLDRPLLDDAAGKLIRPYTVSGGRTHPTAALDLLSLVLATGAAPGAQTGPEHLQALALCRGALTVAELSAHLKLPVAVTKVLVSDLVDGGAITVRPPHHHDHPTDRSLLEAVLDGLRRRL
ncbi:DUF742 domain-containing protein [Streptomyces sp. NPDC094448]|uniref:DUF742 domain-containing protein n=1 Tax=Streptomyces sp. NPDC094448 TaxID=3366063 RepID=UPI0037FA2F30